VRTFLLAGGLLCGAAIVAAQTYKGTATCDFEFDLARKEFRQFCREATPSPTPTPTPVPTPTPTPVPTPTPTPTPPAGPPTAAFYRMGIKLHNIRDTGPNCKKQNPPCLGKVFLFNSTPKSLRPYCDHRPDNPDECEMKTEWQGVIPGSGWADVYMKHASWGNTWEWMDHATGPDGVHPHPFITQHKPTVYQVGRTEIASCPQGVKPPHAKCSVIVQDIR
jgi:hypothetical protein